MNELIAFYKGEVVHPDGYTLDRVLAENDNWLEVKHNYIQWLFPLKKPSDAVPGSPIINEWEMEQFQADAGLKSKLMLSFQRMLKFYGFMMEFDQDDHPTVIKAPYFNKCISNWLTPQNHNFKRITRILESLTLLGLPDMALIFFDALREIYIDDSATIGSTTFRFWKQSVGV